VADDGSAAAIWSHPIDLFATGILVKKYQPATGWDASNETAAISFSSSFSAALSNSGAMSVFWINPGPRGFAIMASRSQF